MVNETVKAAGVTFNKRQNFLKALRSHKKRHPMKLVLVREPENEFDKNAVKIIAKYTLDGRNKTIMIGYIPKKVSSRLAPLMDRGGFVSVENFRFTDTKTVGVIMDLSWVD